MKKRKAILRADGNNATGLGHIYRALAMVEILQNEFDCFFIVKEPGEAIVKLISGYCSLKVLPQTISVADEIMELKLYSEHDSIIVLDGYHFNSQYQQGIKKFAAVLIAIDDKADMHFYADIIFNHGDTSVLDQYKKEAYSKVFAGFEYAVLRKEFIEAARKPAHIINADTLLICMGAADPFNVTNKILSAALQCKFLERITVVTGSAFVFQEELYSVVKKVTKKIVIKSNISANEMVETIRTSGIAICTASTIAMEICCVKTGLIIGKVISNQEAIYNQLVNKGCALGIEDLIAANESVIVNTMEEFESVSMVKDLVNNQSKALDGYSGERIIEAVKNASA